MSVDSDMQTLVQRALATAPVPQVDVAHFRQRQMPQYSRPIKSRRVAALFCMLSLLFGAAAFATVPRILQSVRFIPTGPRTMRVVATRVDVSWRPRGLRQTLGEMHAKPTFAVIEPSGLPTNSRLVTIGVADHQVIFLNYVIGRCVHRRCARHILFILSDARAEKRPLPASAPHGFVGTEAFTIVEKWRSGNESVWTASKGLTLAQVDRIRKAMHGSPMSADFVP